MSDFNTSADAQNNNLSGQQSGGMGGNNTNAAGAQGGGDALDKGVDFLEKQAGHEQNPNTTEKISDGVREAYTKATGDQVPIADKQY